MIETAKCYRCGCDVHYDFEKALADYKERFEADPKAERPVVICDDCDAEIKDLDERDNAPWKI